MAISPLVTLLGPPQPFIEWAKFLNRSFWNQNRYHLWNFQLNEDNFSDWTLSDFPSQTIREGSQSFMILFKYILFLLLEVSCPQKIYNLSIILSRLVEHAAQLWAEESHLQLWDSHHRSLPQELFPYSLYFQDGRFELFYLQCCSSLKIFGFSKNFFKLICQELRIMEIEGL